MGDPPKDTTGQRLANRVSKAYGVFAVCLLLAACGPAEVTFHTADDYPARLSDWGLVSLEGQQLTVSDQAIVYELNTALFSDYAETARFICPKAPTQILMLRIISLYPLAALSAKASSIPKLRVAPC